MAQEDSARREMLPIPHRPPAGSVTYDAKDPAIRFPPIEPCGPDRTPEEGYHFTEDMTDRTIDWVRQQKALMADKPFFVYFSLGAAHAPHHVPTEWSDRYKGRFEQGWERLREETFARQRELGSSPPTPS